MEPIHKSAFTILPRFLSQILAGDKTCEIRSMNCHSALNCRVFLAASGTGQIWGSALVKEVRWASLCDLLEPLALKAHQVPPDELAKYINADCGGAYCWVLDRVVALAEPVGFARNAGSCNWVKLEPSLLDTLAAKTLSSLEMMHSVTASELLSQMEEEKKKRRKESMAKKPTHKGIIKKIIK